MRNKRGAWIVAAALVGVFAAASAARYVPPETLWPLQFLAIGLGPLTFALALLALLSGLRRWWGLSALYLTPVVLALAPPVLTSTSTRSELATPSTEATPLRVVTFNARPESIERGQDAFQELLSKEQPHLVALQEFPVRILTSGRLRGSAYLGPLLRDRAYEITRPEPTEDAILQRPIFARIDSAGAPTFVPSPYWLSEEALWQSGGYTRALYHWEGQTIVIYSIHLHSFSGVRPWTEGWRRMLSPRRWTEALRAYRSDFHTRAEQARVIRRLLEAESYPFLVLGDLNGTSTTWVYTHLSQGLQDAFRQKGTGWGASFPASFPLIRIDFILASPEWNVLRARVDTSVVSDHTPVLAELVLRPAKKGPPGE